jgi:hypothetical protein
MHSFSVSLFAISSSGAFANSCMHNSTSVVHLVPSMVACFSTLFDRVFAAVVYSRWSSDSFLIWTSVLKHRHPASSCSTWFAAHIGAPIACLSVLRMMMFAFFLKVLRSSFELASVPYSRVARTHCSAMRILTCVGRFGKRLNIAVTLKLAFFACVSREFMCAFVLPVARLYPRYVVAEVGFRVSPAQVMLFVAYPLKQTYSVLLVLIVS